MERQQFEKLISNKNKSGLVDFINQNIEFTPFKNQMLAMGNTCTKVDINFLAEWFIYRSEKITPQNVVTELLTFLGQTEINGFEIIAIKGICLQTPVELNNGIKITPYNLLPDSITKAIHNPNSINDPLFKKHNSLFKTGVTPLLFNQTGKPNLTPTAAILIPSKSSPIFVDEKAITNAIFITSKQNDLLNICQALTIVGPSAPSPIATWWEPNEDVPYSRLFGGGSGQYISDVINNTNHIISKTEERELEKICNNYITLPDNPAVSG